MTVGFPEGPCATPPANGAAAKGTASSFPARASAWRRSAITCSRWRRSRSTRPSRRRTARSGAASGPTAAGDASLLLHLIPRGERRPGVIRIQGAGGAAPSRSTPVDAEHGRQELAGFGDDVDVWRVAGARVSGFTRPTRMGNWDTTPTLISKKHSPDEASLTLILFLIANLNTRLILEGGSWSAPIVILTCRGRLALSLIVFLRGVTCNGLAVTSRDAAPTRGP